MEQYCHLLEMAFTANMRESGLEETSDYYVKKLLDQEYVEEHTVMRVLELLNWKPKGYFQVYTLCDQHGDPFDRVKQEFCLFRVKENLKNVIAMSYENYILMICRFSCEDDETVFSEKLYGIFRKNIFHVLPTGFQQMQILFSCMILGK